MKKINTSDRAYQLERQLIRTFGVTLEWFRSQLKAQDYKCAVCEKVFSTTILKDKACVDHNHGTMRLRELLCWRCNVCLGHMADSPSLLFAAAAYLIKHSSSPGERLYPKQQRKSLTRHKKAHKHASSII